MSTSREPIIITKRAGILYEERGALSNHRLCFQRYRHHNKSKVVDPWLK